MLGLSKKTTKWLRWMLTDQELAYYQRRQPRLLKELVKELEEDHPLAAISEGRSSLMRPVGRSVAFAAAPREPLIRSPPPPSQLPLEQVWELVPLPGSFAGSKK
jgi:hypothetical protein